MVDIAGIDSVGAIGVTWGIEGFAGRDIAGGENGEVSAGIDSSGLEDFGLTGGRASTSVGTVGFETSFGSGGGKSQGRGT